MTKIGAFGLAALVAIDSWFIGLAFYLWNSGSSFLLHPRTVLVVGIVLVLLFFAINIIYSFSSTTGKLNLILVCSGALLSVYVIEIGHYTVNHYPGFPRLDRPYVLDSTIVNKAQDNQIWLDKRSKVEVIRDHRIRSVDAYPAFLVTDRSPWKNRPQNKDIGPPLPLGSISNKRIVHCNESGKWSEYQSDKKGFNNPPHQWDNKPIRYLLLGDSFVHGACVDEGQDIASQLRLIGYNSVNIGQRGNGPLLNLAGLKEYGPYLRPKEILWFYTENNDLYNLKSELESSYLKRYLTKGFSQNLYERQDEIDDFITEYTFKHYKVSEAHLQLSLFQHLKYIATLRSLRKRFRLEVPSHAARQGELKRPSGASDSSTSEFKILGALKLLEQMGNSNLDRSKPEIPNYDADQQKYSAQVGQYNHLEEILVEASKFSEQWGGQVVFIYLPKARRFKDPMNPVFLQRSEILDSVVPSSIKIIDMTKVFESSGDPIQYFPFRQGGHYNDEGYKLIAKHIASLLE